MGLDIILYVLMITILTAIAVVAAKYYKELGIFGGLLGALFSYVCLTSEVLILNTAYDQTAQEFVYQTYPITFFAWIPLILMGLNFVLVVKK